MVTGEEAEGASRPETREKAEEETDPLMRRSPRRSMTEGGGSQARDLWTEESTRSTKDPEVQVPNLQKEGTRTKAEREETIAAKAQRETTEREEIK